MRLKILSPIHKATRQIGLHLGDRMTSLGVSAHEAHLLSYLEGYGPAPIFELQRVFGHRPSTLTGMIDRLERRELVCREKNPEDRRSYLIALTEPGRKLAARVSDLVERFEARVLARVGESELAGFRAVMHAVGGVTGVDVRDASGVDVRDAPGVDPGSSGDGEASADGRASTSGEDGEGRLARATRTEPAKSRS